MTEENKNDDILLNEFFSETHNMEIPDNGFSDSVMKSIDAMSSERMSRLSHLWTMVCSLLGICFIVFCIANANIRWYGAEDIIGVVLSYIIHAVKYLSDFKFSEIPQFVFPIPLAITILLAIAAIKNESKYKSLF